MLWLVLLLSAIIIIILFQLNSVKTQNKVLLSRNQFLREENASISKDKTKYYNTIRKFIRLAAKCKKCRTILAAELQKRKNDLQTRNK